MRPATGRALIGLAVLVMISSGVGQWAAVAGGKMYWTELNEAQRPRLVVYVPEDRDKTDHALIELEVADIVMQPGQQPPTRNTRLAIVARNALKSILGDETAAEIENQVDAGKLSLADLNALADKGKDISTGMLSLIFGTSHPQEVALAFLNSDAFDHDIEQKSARQQLIGLLQNALEIDVHESAPLAEVRQRLARQVLLTESLTGLGEAAPLSLGAIKIASASPTRESCISLAHAWRLRREVRDSYVVTAKQVAQILDPSSFVISPSLLETKDNGQRTIDHFETCLFPRRSYRSAEQPCAVRSRSCLHHRHLFGAQKALCPAGTRGSRRSQYPGQHQIRAWLTEPLQIGMDNGARRGLIPLENKRHFLEVAGDIVERVDPIFFSDPMTAAMKALGMT